ncbi:uncharacterized protein LOC143907511 [Temnothorax americanus]|uniref:uncharacterized protein LOC143907511 n=1 Tax=Temnothorax americanus TaxID=1964332 RepID=UPI004068149A
MFALIKFYDNFYYVCKSNRIKRTKNGTKAKYSDGRNYAAIIIAKNDDKDILDEIKKNILINKPRILCERSDFPKICGINTISYIDKNNENNSESVMLTKYSNNEETTVDTLNTCYGKESVMLTKDYNNEETTVDALNTCYDKESVILTKGCNNEETTIDALNTCYDKKFVMLTNDSNNEQTTDDALNTCYGKFS